MKHYTSQVPDSGSSLAQWLAYQESIHPAEIELGLERVQDVADRLKLPDPGIRTITIAGTNGKGSSAHLCEAIYRHAGFSVGLYTSPHLVHYNERVQVNGKMVADHDLIRAFVEVESARKTTSLTYFEYGTLAALWLFREFAVRIQILEVGLGGRLDAVNIVDADAAILTSIGLDHTDWLGADRESIGKEKAAVFRSGRPAICSDPQPPDSVTQTAASTGAVLIQIGRDFEIEASAQTMRWTNNTIQIELPLPGVQGNAQMQNAAGVVAAVQALSDVLPVEEQAIRAALRSPPPQGRIQIKGREILDVAHNLEAMQQLIAVLDAQISSGPVLLVVGMQRGKPVEQIAQLLASRVTHAYCASLPEPRGLSAGELASCFEAAGVAASCHTDPISAHQAALQDVGPNTWILVTGSFLTVSAVLNHG